MDYQTIHRVICDYYRERLGSINYHLAPFSIKSGRSIHGVVFGSRNLYGLEKFLKVCWDIDPKTGEANYSVDKDPSWDGQLSLFPKDNIFRKIDLFEMELKAFIDSDMPNNIQMYQFVLEKGFSPSKALETLKNLQDAGWLLTCSLEPGKKARKGAFYLNHNEKLPRIIFKKAKSAL